MLLRMEQSSWRAANRQKPLVEGKNYRQRIDLDQCTPSALPRSAVKMLYSSMHRPLWVKSSPAHDSVYAAEVPQKADRIAAAPRKEKVCQIQRSAGYAGKKQEVKVHHDEG